VLLALGDVKYQVLAYLNRRKDIEIVKLETRYMKKREKGLGLKLIIEGKTKLLKAFKSKPITDKLKLFVNLSSLSDRELFCSEAQFFCASEEGYAWPSLVFRSFINYCLVVFCWCYEAYAFSIFKECYA
jgi:hypothetical protein